MFLRLQIKVKDVGYFIDLVATQVIKMRETCWSRIGFIFMNNDSKSADICIDYDYFLDQFILVNSLPTSTDKG